MTRVKGDDLFALGQRTLNTMFADLGERVGGGEARQAAQDLRARGQGLRGDAWEAGYAMLRSFEPNPRGQITAAGEGARALGALADNLRGRDLDRAAIERLPGQIAPFVRALYALNAIQSPPPARPNPRLLRGGITHTLDLMRNAAGDNNILSRRERSRLLSGLEQAGRTDEARAVKYLYAIADGLSKGSPRADDFNALEAQLDGLVAGFDQGRPGLWDDEARLSDEALALNRVGQLAAAGAIAPDLAGVAEPAEGGRADLDGMTAPKKLDRLLDAARGMQGSLTPVAQGDLPAAVAAALQGRMQSVRTGLDSVFGAHPGQPSNSTTNFARIDGQTNEGPETIGHRGTVRATFPSGNGGGTGLEVEHHADYEGNGLGLMVRGLTTRRDPADPNGYTPRLEARMPNLFSDENDAPYTGRDWKPDFTVTDAELTARFAEDPDDALAFLAMAARMAQVDNPFNIEEAGGRRREGEWKVGRQNVDGAESIVVRWNDIDDASFAYVFRPEDGRGNPKAFEASKYVYVN